MRHSWTPAITWDISFMRPTAICSEYPRINMNQLSLSLLQGFRHYWSKRLIVIRWGLTSRISHIFQPFGSGSISIMISLEYSFIHVESYSIYMYLLDIYIYIHIIGLISINCHIRWFCCRIMPVFRWWSLWIRKGCSRWIAGLGGCWVSALGHRGVVASEAMGLGPEPGLGMGGWEDGRAHWASTSLNLTCSDCMRL